MNIRLVIYCLFTRASYHIVNVLRRPHMLVGSYSIRSSIKLGTGLHACAFHDGTQVSSFIKTIGVYSFCLLSLMYACKFGRFSYHGRTTRLSKVIKLFHPSLRRNTPRIGSGIELTPLPKGTSLKYCHRGRAVINSSRACNQP
jgi:hypothetical protein